MERSENERGNKGGKIQGAECELGSKRVFRYVSILNLVHGGGNNRRMKKEEVRREGIQKRKKKGRKR